MTTEPSGPEILADALLKDAEAHEDGRYDDIGERYDDVYGELLPMDDVKDPHVSLALGFWDGWSDARNHDWQYYEGIGERDWPRLRGKSTVDMLRTGADPADPVLLRHFRRAPRTPFRERLRAWIQRRGTD